MPEQPRPVATDRDTLTIEETADHYARAGHPRTIRTIQRYCATGHLECTKATTSLGDKYFVHPESIRRHLAQIAEFSALEHDATERGESRPVATTEPDMSRHDATHIEYATKHADYLEGELDRMRDDNLFLREQIHTKDRQIDALLERDRETNHIVRALQQMLSPLLGAPKPRDHDALQENQ